MLNVCTEETNPGPIADFKSSITPQPRACQSVPKERHTAVLLCYAFSKSSRRDLSDATVFGTSKPVGCGVFEQMIIGPRVMRCSTLESDIYLVNFMQFVLSYSVLYCPF